ncbi:MAG: hypothetical protein AB7U75_02740 [Hyphomicrobiaceae bacterium]
MRTRAYITVLAAMMISAVLFGTFVTMILSIPALKTNADLLIPLSILASLIIAPLLGWKLAPEVRSKVIRREHQRGNDWY